MKTGTEPEYIYVKGEGWVPRADKPWDGKYDHADLTMWRCADGTLMRVVDMSSSHLINAIKKLNKRVGELTSQHIYLAGLGCVDCEEIDALYNRIRSLSAELNKRPIFLR